MSKTITSLWSINFKKLVNRCLPTSAGGAISQLALLKIYCRSKLVSYWRGVVLAEKRLNLGVKTMVRFIVSLELSSWWVKKRKNLKTPFLILIKIKKNLKAEWRLEGRLKGWPE